MADTKKPMGVSIDPDDAVTGGGLFASEPTTVVFSGVETCMFDYQGKAKAAPALKIEMSVDGDSETYPHYLSAGSADDFAPSKDGTRLEALKDGVALRKSCNLVTFMASLKEAGFPFKDKDHIPEDERDNFKILEGLECVVVRKEAPKRAGLSRSPKKNQDGKEYVDTILVVDKIVSLPWEGGSGSGAEESDAGGGGEDSELTAKAITMVISALEDAPKSGYDSAQLSATVFKLLKGDADQTNIVTNFVHREEFLNDNKVDGETGIPRWEVSGKGKTLKVKSV